MLNTVMKTAKITAFIVLYGFTRFPDSFFLSIKRHGIRMYVLEIVKLRDDAMKSIMETQVLAMNPFEIVVFMNLDLCL